MNILVTGGAGFIGSNYCHFLNKYHPEDRIVVLDALTYAGNLSSLSSLQECSSFKFYQGRIEDKSFVVNVIQKERINAIVNFAAETHNDRSLLSAGDFLKTNVLGVHSLLEAVNETKIERLVHVSTDEVYGSIDDGEFTEESPLQPNTPYSASKAGGDLLCRSYYVAYETPVIITRGGNTYGPYQYPEKLISFFAVRLIQNKKVPLYGEGKQVREWIYVDDHVSGIDVALRKGIVGEVYNISDKNELQNAHVVERILNFYNLPKDLVKNIPDPRKNAHDKRYSMNSDKLRKLGWEPKTPFNKGLQKTLSFYKENENWWKPITEKPEYKDFIKNFYGKFLGDDL